jgi:hypothetical protein
MEEYLILDTDQVCTLFFSYLCVAGYVLIVLYLNVPINTLFLKTNPWNKCTYLSFLF